MGDKKLNRYDYGIFLLVALLAFGGIGGAFQPIRIFGMLFLPYICLQLVTTKSRGLLQRVVLFFSIWLVYAAISLLWTPSKAEGIKEIIYLVVHFSLFLQLVLWAKKASNSQGAIIWGWITVLAATLPIAVYEVITFQHLNISRFGSDKTLNLGGEIVRFRFASATFLNSNSYVVLLAFCLPFLLMRLLYQTKRIVRLFLSFVLLISIFILLINASRGGLICLLIYLSLFGFYTWKGTSTASKLRSILTMAFAIFFVGLVVNSYFNEFFTRFFYRLELGGESFVTDENRFSLYGIAFTLLRDSLYLGTGVGSQQIAMGSLSRGNVAIHNLFVEVLMQYGVVIFCLFCGFLFSILFRLKSNRLKHVKYIHWCFFIAFIPLFIINSGYLLMPALWILFGSLFVISKSSVAFYNQQ